MDRLGSKIQIMKKLTELTEWQTLKAHQQSIANIRMQDWFKDDPNRFNTFSLSVSDLFLDYSKNRISTETLHLLSKLAIARHLPERIEQLFSGYPLNNTEERPALHTALRHPTDHSLLVNGHNIM